MGIIDKQSAAPEELPEDEIPMDQPDEGEAPVDEAPTGDADDDGGGGLKITPELVASKMNTNPKQAAQLKKIVEAGMKVMFDPKTEKLVDQTLAGEGDIATKLGQTGAGLMGILIKESRGAIPGELIIPAGTILVAHAADFLSKIGQEVTDEDVGNAIEIFTTIVIDQNQASPEERASMEGGQGEQAPAGAPQPPPGGGIISGGMQ